MVLLLLPDDDAVVVHGGAVDVLEAAEHFYPKLDVLLEIFEKLLASLGSLRGGHDGVSMIDVLLLHNSVVAVVVLEHEREPFPFSFHPTIVAEYR